MNPLFKLWLGFLSLISGLFMAILIGTAFGVIIYLIFHNVFDSSDAEGIGFLAGVPTGLLTWRRSTKLLFHWSIK